MSNNYWFSADVDTGEVVAKTEIKGDGSIRRYEYTKPDDITAGHGDKSYDSYEDFENDNPSYIREKDDSLSINRRWYGNGYDLTLETLNNEALEEVQELLMTSSKYYDYTFEEMLVSNMHKHKQLVLK